MLQMRNSPVLWAIPLLLVVCLVSVPAGAKYAGGSGTAQDPYQIATAVDLILLGETPTDYDKHFILTANLDLDPNLPGRKVFDKAVIAPDTDPAKYDFQGTRFTGVVDGNGHTISHLTINGVGHLGLFGWLGVGAEIKNLGVVDVNVTGSGDRVGGLVGTNYSSVTHCYSTGAVSATGGEVGGLVGANCYAAVTDCYSAGTVTGGGSVGGLVGNNMGGTISCCYSTGDVSGNSGVGGLVGSIWGDVIDCYSTARVSGKSGVGGLVGYVNDGGAEGCFWDIQTSGQKTAVPWGGTGRTTAEMQTAKTFLDAGWDFVGETANGTEDIWWIREGKDYPRLWWERAGRYGGGTGEPNDPYLIYTAQQMNAIGTEPNDWSKHFKVMADIDLSAYDGKAGRPAFNIIAPDTDPARFYYQGIAFTGVFDGGKHKLSHLTIQGVSYLGLFGELAATAQVRDVWIEDVNVTGSGDSIAALAAESRGAITHCYSTGVVNATGAAQERGYAVGGLVASNFGDMTFCHSIAAVNGGTYVGGFAGNNWGIIARCYSAGSVRGGGSVGGFVGENLSIVTRCYAWGPVAGDSYVGGLVGENYQGQVTDCYSTGAVSGGWYVGGLVGQNGGLTEAGKLAAVTKCYSAGAVKGQSYVGGLVGHNDAAVTACFWDRQASGQTASAGGTGKTTVEMRTSGTFLSAGWDFAGETANGTEDIWEINEGKDYPRLRSEMKAVTEKPASGRSLP